MEAEASGVVGSSEDQSGRSLHLVPHADDSTQDLVHSVTVRVLVVASGAIGGRSVLTEVRLARHAAKWATLERCASVTEDREEHLSLYTSSRC